VDLQVVDKWDGVTPLAISGAGNLLLSLQELEAKSRAHAVAP
jgi:hypothetical protein